MDKLKPEHLHLLIDEPIYVLDRPIKQPEDAPEVKEKAKTEPEVAAKAEEPQEELIAAETKDILILIEDKNSELIAAEDEEFLFKGLNALGIDKAEVSIHNINTSGLPKPPLMHKKQIAFKESPDEAKLFKVLDASGIAHLECHQLSAIRNNLELKKQFWLGLKALFGK